MICRRIALALVLPLVISTTCGAVVPDLNSATLETEGVTIRPLRVLPVGRAGTLVDDLVVSIQDDRITAIRTTDGSEKWTTRFKGGQYLQLLAAKGEMLFLQGWDKLSKKGREEYHIAAPGEIQRVSTKDGTWLKPLVIGTPLLGGKRLQTVAVVTSTNHVFVLDVERGDSDMHEVQINSYRVSCFTGGSTRPLWQKKYKSAGSVPSVGVGILFQGDPMYAKSQLKMLSPVGDILIVCAGAVEDVIALDMSSGEEKWRLPAVWEFQRGFIGPSVWQHFVARCGVQEHDLDEKGIVDEDYRKEVRRTNKRVEQEKSDLAQSCRIVGGPAAVPTQAAMQERYYKCKNCGKYHGTKPSQQHRVFVAVSEATGDYGGYLAACRVYEIDERGQPIAVVNMPRMVMGSQFHMHKGGVIWRCDAGAVAKLVPSQQSRGIGMGPGGSDCIARLAWYTEPEADPSRSDTMDAPSPHWLSWSKADDPVAFDGDVMYRLPSGGYIHQSTDTAMVLPISRCILPDDAPETIALHISFTGAAEKPNSNYRGSGDSTYSYRPLNVSIVDFAVASGSLVVTVASADGDQTMLFFDLKNLPMRNTGTAQQAESTVPSKAAPSAIGVNLTG